MRDEHDVEAPTTEHEEDMDVTPDSVMAVLGQLGDPGSAPDPGDEGDSDGDLLDLFDPQLFGYSAHDVVMGLVGAEESDELASGAHQELSAAAARSLSDARKASRKKAGLVSYDEEDFEGPQRDAFILIKHHKNLLFGASSPGEDQWKAIDWFFTVQDDGNQATFDLACRTFDARIDVVRLRIQYEFFLRWFYSPVDFPFLTVPVPDVISGEIAYVSGDPGHRLARLVWNRPGILTSDLLAKSGSDKATLDALVTLEDRYILSRQPGNGNDYWYLTGRNPMRLRQRISESKGHLAPNVGGTIHWSRLL